MQAISEAARERRRDLIMAEGTNADKWIGRCQDAFDRYIQQVSDAAKVINRALSADGRGPFQKALVPFILPDPPEDPLEEALAVAGKFSANNLSLLPGYAATVRAELAKRGLKIAEVSV